MELDRERIHARLRRLARKDRQRRVFGAASHNYLLNPPAKVAEIEAFERRHGIALPEDYRRFLTEIGNGGAGPAYGVFPFGYDDEGRWGEVLALGDVGQPFPHHEPWNLDVEFWEGEPDISEEMPEEEEQRLLDEWDRTLEANYWNPALMNGAIPICHLGCARRHWLIVHGDQRGCVWDDMRADHGGIAPLRDTDGNLVTFAEWYLRWLDEAERGEQPQKHGVLPSRTSHRRTRRESLTLALLVLAGVALGLILALL